MTQWYVLHVRTGHELSIRNRLHTLGYPALVPRETCQQRTGGAWREVERLLFPSYVFVQLTLTPEVYYNVKSVPCIINFLGAYHKPEPLPNHEASYIRTLAPTDDPLGVSDIIMEGDTVRVLSGVLSEFTGHILSIDRRQHRAKVEVIFFGQPKVITLSVNVLEKCR